MYYRNTPLITPPTIHAYLRMTAFQYYCDSVLANSYIITSPHPMNRARRWYTVVTFLLIILFVLLACIIFEHILFFLKNTFISVCCLLEMFICKKWKFAKVLIRLRGPAPMSWYPQNTLIVIIIIVTTLFPEHFVKTQTSICSPSKAAKQAQSCPLHN